MVGSLLSGPLPWSCRIRQLSSGASFRQVLLLASLLPSLLGLERPLARVRRWPSKMVFCPRIGPARRRAGGMHNEQLKPQRW